MDDLDQARAALRARQGSGARYEAAGAPADTLALARLGTAYFARKLNELGDADLARPSARRGWSRARVVAATALQARAIAQAIEDATGMVSDERAETDLAALALAETLPPRALRNLEAHADVHLAVVWRDLEDAGWDGQVTLAEGARPTRDTPRLRALAVWGGALALGNGGRLRDVPEALRDAVAAQDLRDAVASQEWRASVAKQE